MVRRWAIAAMMLSAAAAHGMQGGRMMQATGPFDVEMKPDASASGGYGRNLMSKHYHGALEATAAGEMLSGGDPKAGTAGYVAIETVTGTLDGRTGTFQLMQWGTMADGKRELRVGVVPGSGTGALKGISGTMTIAFEPNGAHTYRLEYAVAETH